VSRVATRSAFATFRDQYAELMRSAFLIDLQYRASIAIWLLWGITEPIISLGIWWSIAAGGAVDGYTREDFARYFFGVALVNQATLSWDAWNIDRWIREGEMNFRLTRPIAPIHEAIADNIAYKAPTAVIILTAWIGAATFWPAVRIPFEPGRWALAIIAIVLAAAVRAAEYLWFPYVLSFPVEVLTGTVTTGGQYARGFGGQAIWLAIWLLLYLLVWTRGRRRYGAVGG